MARTIRLLEVDHDQISVRVLVDRVQRDAGLIVGERAHLVPIQGFQLKVREGFEAGADALGDAEIRLG